MEQEKKCYQEKRFYQERRFRWIMVWFFAYMLGFFLLEGRTYIDPVIIHTALDDLIPFQISFVYVYLFWFPYMVGLMFWAIFGQSREASDKTVGFLISGMMIFLLISWVMPNGLDFRRYLFYDTATTAGMLMEWIHHFDTPTNVFPSMHVFMTLGFQVSLVEQHKHLRPVVLWSSRLMALLIVLSTVFLKQHSVIDVIGAIVLTAGLYWYFYCRNKK